MIGLVARADNSGLGTMSRELWDNLEIDRAAVITNGVYRTFPERFGATKAITAAEFTDDAVRRFLEGLECVLTVETPYNWNLYAIAREMGVKTVMFPMYECLKKDAPRPDLYICPSLLDFEEVEGNKVMVPFPVNTERVQFRVRERAQVFVHNAGHGGLLGRNGTDILLDAIPRVKSDVRFLIRSQTPIHCDDPRVEVRVANVRDYATMWNEGDVFVFPHKFDGLSLPVQEALAAGMPLITTRMHPFDKWLPTEFLVDVQRTEQIRLSRPITASFISPAALAARIDAYAGRPIAQLSMLAGGYGEDLSWNKLRPKYQEILEDLCENAR